MYATVTQPLTFEEFLAWDDGSGREFWLVIGCKPNSQTQSFGQIELAMMLFMQSVVHWLGQHSDTWDSCWASGMYKYHYLSFGACRNRN